MDKNNKKTFAKESSITSESNISTPLVNESELYLNGEHLIQNEKIQLLFQKCKPRNDHQTIEFKASRKTPTSRNLKSVGTSFHQTHLNSASISKMNNKLENLQSSPDHLHLGQFSEPDQNLKKNNKHEQKENYVETNPFRISTNNRYFYNSNESLLNNNHSAAAASYNSSSMHHYHYPSMVRRNYQIMASEERSCYLEADEIEHNPYVLESCAGLENTIPSSILQSTPPATPPVLATSPIDLSPLEGNKSLWDLSPVKETNSTGVKSQLQENTSFSRSHKSSYKKLLSSPVSFEEDLESGHFYYNNKNTYYQAPQTDSDSNEPATQSDNKKNDQKSSYRKSSIIHSESNEFLYAEINKKEDRKMVKSKSGSGIMGSFFFQYKCTFVNFLLNYF